MLDLSVYLSREVPGWGLALALYLLSVEVVKDLRWHFEKKRYNVASSSEYGDPVLIGVFSLMAHQVEKHGVPYDFMKSWFWHVAIAAIWLVIGYVLNKDGSGQKGDTYHNFFVLPLLGYLLTSLAPVVIKMDLYLSALCVLGLVTWTVLVIWDFKTGRINQIAWQKARGLYPAIKR